MVTGHTHTHAHRHRHPVSDPKLFRPFLPFFFCTGSLLFLTPGLLSLLIALPIFDSLNLGLPFSLYALYRPSSVCNTHLDTPIPPLLIRMTLSILRAILQNCLSHIQLYNHLVLVQPPLRSSRQGGIVPGGGCASTVIKEKN